MVNSNLGKIGKMKYPGRYILMQIERDREIIIYGITGRSPSSQARKFVKRANGVYVEPTNKEVLKQGKAELLIYPNTLWNDRIMVVSNGEQTKPIFDEINKNLGNPSDSFMKILNKYDYEPDPPHYTPRISGYISDKKAELGIIFRDENGESVRKTFPVEDGGVGISTYEGPDTGKEPLPSYTGEPFPVKLDGTVMKIAEDVWKGITEEFRVSLVATVRYLPANRVHNHIINKNGYVFSY